jgi:hypothetical protein
MARAMFDCKGLQPVTMQAGQQGYFWVQVLTSKTFAMICDESFISTLLFP